MTEEEQRLQKVSPKHRRFDLRGASLIIITVLVITLFTGGMAYSVQSLVTEAKEGVLVDGVREFRISVQQWYYEPAIIRVNPGDTIRFVVSSQDIRHGFSQNELGINLTVSPRKAVIHAVVVPSDMAEGTYTLYCSVFCGMGHPYLRGKMIVGAPTMFLGVRMEKVLPYFATSVMAGVFAIFIAKGRRRVR